MNKILFIMLSLFLSACAPLVNIDYDTKTDFTSLKSYSNNITPVRVSEDTRVNSPFMLKRVTQEIDVSLSTSGFSSTKNNPDMLVKYHLDIRQEVETQQSGFTIGFGTSTRNTAVGFAFNAPAEDTGTIDKLVLTIDIYNGKKLIWRGSKDYTLYKGQKPSSYDELIKDLVSDILKNFPPKK